MPFIKTKDYTESMLQYIQTHTKSKSSHYIHCYKITYQLEKNDLPQTLITLSSLIKNPVHQRNFLKDDGQKFHRATGESYPKISKSVVAPEYVFINKWHTQKMQATVISPFFLKKIQKYL